MKKLCLHEAGHLIYFERVRETMGQGTPELRFVGPTITFNSLKSEFEFTPATVRTPFEDCGLVYTDEILSYLALGAVAGGVFLRELQNDTSGGDSADREVFEVHFSMARGQGLTPKFNSNQMWIRARDKVQGHLENDDFKRCVLARAAEIEKGYFSPLSGS